MKGILLAGGLGTRLYPITSIISKQLLNVYNKPMIYYPLATLMQLGIKDILIISTPQDIPSIQALLKDGRHLGLNIDYHLQYQPNGIAEAFVIAEPFIQNENVCLILGDNFFYSPMIDQKLVDNFKGGAHIFAYPVNNPKDYGVITFNDTFHVTSLEEKPKQPKSSFAVPGLYFYDHQVSLLTRQLVPSQRGELEITDLNKLYMELGQLSVTPLTKNSVWYDMGSFDNLLMVSNFIYQLDKNYDIRIGYIEELARQMGYIGQEEWDHLLFTMTDSPYKRQLGESHAVHMPSLISHYEFFVDNNNEISWPIKNSSL